jgi:hypothetical protein
LNCENLRKGLEKVYIIDCWGSKRSEDTSAQQRLFIFPFLELKHELAKAFILKHGYFQSSMLSGTVAANPADSGHWQPDTDRDSPLAHWQWICNFTSR